MTRDNHLHQIARAKARAMRKLKIDRIRLLARSSVPFLLNGPSPREIGKAAAVHSRACSCFGCKRGPKLDKHQLMEIEE